jgi:uracil-DNA glycosylase
MGMIQAETGWLQHGCHLSWEPLLDDRTRLLLTSIEVAVGPDCLPVSGSILRFLKTDVNRLQVVILGQDPYPAPGAATGRAFEVGGLKSWSDPFRQVSLKNIVRLIWCANHGIRPFERNDEYGRIPTFSQIRVELKENHFALAAPDRLFQSWEEQGVLLLNTSLTVSAGNPGAHKEAWLPFTRLVISFLARVRPDLTWFLWGSHAQAHSPFLGTAQAYRSRHPMLCSPAYADDFLMNPCFHETSGLVDWTGTRQRPEPGNGREPGSSQEPGSGR